MTQGSNAEYTTYLGIPLLVLLAVIVVRFRRVGLIPLFSLVAVVAWVITLGPTLHFGTTHHPAIKLPYYWLQSVALVNGALDLRYSLIMYLAVAVVVAVGLDRFAREGLRTPSRRRAQSRRAERRRGAVCGVVAVLALLPLLPRLPYQSSPIGTPALFTAKNSPIADGDVVLSLPLPVGYEGSNDQALLWQAAAGMRYKLIGFRGAVPGVDHRPIRDAALLLPPLEAEDLLSWGLYGQPAPATATRRRHLRRHPHLPRPLRRRSGGDRAGGPALAGGAALLHRRPGNPADRFRRRVRLAPRAGRPGPSCGRLTPGRCRAAGLTDRALDLPCVDCLSTSCLVDLPSGHERLCL